jgi:hypothetical protein
VTLWATLHPPGDASVFIASAVVPESGPIVFRPFTPGAALLQALQAEQRVGLLLIWADSNYQQLVQRVPLDRIITVCRGDHLSVTTPLTNAELEALAAYQSQSEQLGSVSTSVTASVKTLWDHLTSDVW